MDAADSRPVPGGDPAEAAPFARTQSNQWLVSDPARSAWVVANAGSGKTHVLTQRVLRLLLSGADPASVLCLTFTKVAAAEMSRRVFGELGRWTILPEAELRAAIRELQGVDPAAQALVEARRLFARALETPGGLKIQTIHAFCERLLHQFPLEANVPGQFAILDDSSAAALVAEARAQTMLAASLHPGGRLGTALRWLSEHATDMQIGAALDAVVAGREDLRRWMEQAAADGETGSVDDALADLRARLGLEPGEDEAAICRAICQAAGWGHADCSSVAATIAEALAAAAHVTNDRAHKRLAAILASSGDAAEAQARLHFFLQPEKDGWRAFEPDHRFRSHRFGADFGRANAGLLDRFEAESARLLALAEKLRAARNLAATEALLVVGDAILQDYGAAKRRAGQLDFGDLIVKARNLLSRADAAAWVLYKLDARIEHILVDEAQDTSPDQWAVVKALAGDFFAGESRARGPRTIFAVGDDKQSIFSFQGGAPHMLADMARFFDRAARGVDEDLVQRPLFLSFRSTQEVLGAVDTVFGGALKAEITASDYEAHAAHRHDHPGRIVVLPRVVRERAVEPEDWTEPHDAPARAEVALAATIAAEIGRLIGTALPSGKRVAAGDVLVLVRKRGAFAAAMNQALRAAGIPAAGADRIPVATHIAVLDLLALADVMLLPEDDLQLAACLKSPLVGLTEDDLAGLCVQRGSKSLWRQLQAAEDERLRAVAERLRRWLGFADQVTPFRWLAALLGSDGGRRAFRARLGGEVDEVLDALLGQALAYEAIEPPSLQGFLRYVRASQGDIKRDAEAAASGVRVMTVHGAKGLEADVVFLVDVGGQIVVPGQRATLVPVGGGALLWRRSGVEATQQQRQADAAADRETRSEYLRLLYVAMTRARDLLYVAGIRAAKGEEAGCWYSRIAAPPIVPESAERDPETGELAGPCEWPDPARPPRDPQDAAEAPRKPPAVPPAWLHLPAPPPPPVPQPLRPSRALGEPDFQPDRNVAASASPGSFRALRRGQVVHRLLQVLPGLAPQARDAVVDRLVKDDLADDPDLAREAARECAAVLAHADLADIFGPGSRAEVPIVGELDTAQGRYAVNGQIDRLRRDEGGWRIVDFKTSRTVPRRASDATAAVLQLALYRRLLMDMEPGAPVAAALVWTAAANVMPLSADLMEQALAAIGIRAAAIP